MFIFAFSDLPIYFFYHTMVTIVNSSLDIQIVQYYSDSYSRVEIQPIRVYDPKVENSRYCHS